MKEANSNPVKFNLNCIIFIVSILVSLFWWSGQVIDVYQYKLVGIIYEIIWLPAVVALFIIPVISAFFWMKEKFKLKSFFPYSIIITVTTLIVLILNS